MTGKFAQLKTDESIIAGQNKAPAGEDRRKILSGEWA